MLQTLSGIEDLYGNKGNDAFWPELLLSRIVWCNSVLAVNGRIAAYIGS